MARPIHLVLGFSLLILQVAIWILFPKIFFYFDWCSIQVYRDFQHDCQWKFHYFWNPVREYISPCIKIIFVGVGAFLVMYAERARPIIGFLWTPDTFIVDEELNKTQFYMRFCGYLMLGLILLYSFIIIGLMNLKLA